MADETTLGPDEASKASESLADNSTNSNPAPAPAPDMHGFTSEQLADMKKFFDNNGGFDAIKSKISNPQLQQQVNQQPEQQVSSQPEQQANQQPEQQISQQPEQLPKGFASWQELSVERYFKDLAANPKYANISKEIENGEILKEMTSFGMTPIDGNYNVNVEQINKFLELKSASVPASPTSAEPTNIPTVEYVNQGQTITDRNTAFDILRQSFELEQRGLAPHPDKIKAQEFLQKK